MHTESYWQLRSMFFAFDLIVSVDLVEVAFYYNTDQALVPDSGVEIAPLNTDSVFNKGNYMYAYF